MDGQTLVSGGGVDATEKVYELNPFREVAAYPLEMGWITRLVFSPDGQTLAVSGGSFHRPGEIKLLNWPGCIERRRFIVAANSVSSVVFTRDGKMLIAGTAPVSPFTARPEGELYRWNLGDGSALLPLRAAGVLKPQP